MSADAITQALFLIAAVIAAGVLINAIFPVITQTAGTFGSVSHEADVRIRTDMRIVATYAKSPDAKVWLKNIGTSRIHTNEVDGADIFFGEVGGFDRIPYSAGLSQDPSWNYEISGNTNSYWDPGETLTVIIKDSDIPSDADQALYYQIVLPNGVSRSTEFLTYSTM